MRRLVLGFAAILSILFSPSPAVRSTTIVYVVGRDWIVAAHDIYMLSQNKQTLGLAPPKIRLFQSAVMGFSGQNTFCGPVTDTSNNGKRTRHTDVQLSDVIDHFVLDDVPKDVSDRIALVECRALQSARYDPCLDSMTNAADLLDKIAACATPCDAPDHWWQPVVVGVASAPGISTYASAQCPRGRHQRESPLFCNFRIEAPTGVGSGTSVSKVCEQERQSTMPAVFTQGMTDLANRIANGFDDTLGKHRRSRRKVGLNLSRNGGVSSDKAAQLAIALVDLQLEVSRLAESDRSYQKTDPAFLSAWGARERRFAHDIRGWRLVASGGSTPTLEIVDTIRPSVVIDLPTPDQEFRGGSDTVARVSDDSGIRAVGYQAELAESASGDTLTKRIPTKDLASVNNGFRKLTWWAEDKLGNLGWSAPVGFRVCNQAGATDVTMKVNGAIPDPTLTLVKSRDAFEVVARATNRDICTSSSDLHIQWMPADALTLESGGNPATLDPVHPGATSKQVSWRLRATTIGPEALPVTITVAPSDPAGKSTGAASISLWILP